LFYFKIKFSSIKMLELMDNPTALYVALATKEASMNHTDYRKSETVGIIQCDSVFKFQTFPMWSLQCPSASAFSYVQWAGSIARAAPGLFSKPYLPRIIHLC
jgi:hypothetical protein